VDFQRIQFYAADFHGGKNSLRRAFWRRRQQQETLLVYQQTIRAHPRRFRRALGYRKDQEFRAQQELLAHSAQDAAQLSSMRYQSGTTSYLEVLTNKPTTSPRTRPWRKPGSMNSSPWCKSIKPSAAAGSSNDITLNVRAGTRYRTKSPPLKGHQGRAIPTFVLRNVYKRTHS